MGVYNKLKIVSLCLLLLSLISIPLIIFTSKGSKNNFETIGKQREKMEKKLSIAEDDKNSSNVRFYALIAIVKDKEIRKFPELEDEFKKRLWRLIQKNKRKRFGVTPLDALGGLSLFYKKNPPSKEEQRMFLDLLTDTKNSPIVRSTSAYFLRNTSDSKAKEGVKNIAERLLRRYRKIPELKNSQAAGRLMLTLAAFAGRDPDEMFNEEESQEMSEQMLKFMKESGQEK